jgi:hypothetical protein
MKKTCLSSILIFFCILTIAQPQESLNLLTGDQDLYATNPATRQNTFLRNYIAAYLGIFEWNINYERNVFDLPRSYINLRLGIGSWVDQPGSGGEGGFYVSPCFVLLTSKNPFHFEFDFGARVFAEKPPLPWSKYPFDIFLGCRYERREGKGAFRIGVNIPTMLNIGYGFKF